VLRVGLRFGELTIGCDVTKLNIAVSLLPGGNTKLNTSGQGVYHRRNTLVLAFLMAIPGGNELGSEHYTHDKSPGNWGGWQDP